LPANPNLLEYWYLALRSQSGICIRVHGGEIEKVRQKLYSARTAAMDPQLNAIQLSLSPTADDELWLVHSTRTEEPSDAPET
jgi:hypothetical protein